MKQFKIENKEVFKNKILTLEETNKQLAQKLQVDESITSNWSRGIRLPNSQNILKIMETYKLSPEEIGAVEKEEIYITKFSEKLNQLLKNNNMKDTDLADALHVAKSTISNWKNSKNPPSKHYIEKITEYFNLPKSYFDEEYNEQDIIASMGLTIETVNKFRKFKNISERGLFKLEQKSIFDINELEVANYIISKTDFVEYFTKQIIEFCKIRNEMKEAFVTKKSSTSISKSEYTRYLKLKQKRKSTMIERISNKSEQVFKEYSKQINDNNVEKAFQECLDQINDSAKQEFKEYSKQTDNDAKEVFEQYSKKINNRTKEVFEEFLSKTIKEIK